ncbi:unnamed protein product [Paramecium octaurelia]|uniref:Uncharacterized protein n=1 Tax=Paramecium octaurelia TaxID=43137 RepID=A0A8S1TVR1_PAROT|nr:unnamed protein product [Paramecium octaurelia]
MQKSYIGIQDFYYGFSLCAIKCNIISLKIFQQLQRRNITDKLSLIEILKQAQKSLGFNKILYRLKQAKKYKCIRFHEILMSQRYLIDLLDLEEYFGMKVQYNQKSELRRRKKNRLENRRLNLIFQINDYYIQEMEIQGLHQLQQIRQWKKCKTKKWN